MGGKATPGIGFAMGVERLVLLIEAVGAPAPAPERADVYVVAVGDNAHRTALAAIEALRTALPELRVIQHVGGGSFKSQLKKADKSGAAVALIVGEDEAAAGVAGLKPLRGQGEQTQVALGDLAENVSNIVMQDITAT